MQAEHREDHLRAEHVERGYREGEIARCESQRDLADQRGIEAEMERAGRVVPKVSAGYPERQTALTLAQTEPRRHQASDGYAGPVVHGVL